MLILLTIFSKASGSCWNMLKRRLAEEKITPLTIIHAPNVVGHPIGIATLVLLGMFVLPTDPLFLVYWFWMIIIAAIVSIFTIFGLLETKFFTAQIIGSLGFVSSSICAASFYDEWLNAWAIFALCLAVIGVICFSWRNNEGKILPLIEAWCSQSLPSSSEGFRQCFINLSPFTFRSTALFLRDGLLAIL